MPQTASAPLDSVRARRNMVDGQVRTFDVTDRALIVAMEELPRERFVPPASLPLAYSDLPLEFGPRGGSRRAMLPPMVLARMIQALEIESGAKVLDVGSGPGYGSAILARLGATVVALETEPELAAGAAEGLATLGLAEAVTPRFGSLADGLPGDAPFDAVLVNGAVEVVPDTLIGQLSGSGRLVCLVQDGRRCTATLFVRSGEAVGRRALFDAGAALLDAFRAPAEFTF